MSDSEYFSPYRSDGKLYGFVCVVTGAMQPVGKAIVHELAVHGAACIYACSRSSDADASNLSSEINKTYPNTKIIGYPLDIADEQDTLALIDEALNSFGRLDVWVCSSGLLGPSSLDATTPTDLQRCFETNSMAPFFALKYAPPAMAKLATKGHYPNAAPKDQQYGSIIVVSSVASTYGGCWGPCFTMSSHAALGVVRAGVAVLKGTGVRINCISPGQIDSGVSLGGFDMRGMTEQLPPASLQSKEIQKANIGLERAGLPIEVARVAGFLASGFSSYVTGANLVVDGGASTMCPLTWVPRYKIEDMLGPPGDPARDCLSVQKTVPREKRGEYNYYYTCDCKFPVPQLLDFSLRDLAELCWSWPIVAVIQHDRRICSHCAREIDQDAQDLRSEGGGESPGDDDDDDDDDRAFSESSWHTINSSDYRSERSGSNGSQSTFASSGNATSPSSTIPSSVTTSTANSSFIANSSSTANSSSASSSASSSTSDAMSNPAPTSEFGVSSDFSDGSEPIPRDPSKPLLKRLRSYMGQLMSIGLPHQRNLDYRRACTVIYRCRHVSTTRPGNFRTRACRRRWRRMLWTALVAPRNPESSFSKRTDILLAKNCPADWKYRKEVIGALGSDSD
ncbi:hypothetical protein MMC25_000445 [Agyrium rufum]|nr:hypothetical protein [Agyrium rufum]